MPAVTHIFLHTSPLVIYVLVAVILMLESAAIPIANNTLLLLTGALASSGRLNIWVLFVVALLGSVAGACLAYIVGAQSGRRILLRIAKLFRVSEQKLAMVERWCQRSGPWMIFFSRMTPYVRPFACFPAGMSRMPFPRFLLAAFSGSFIWCVGMLWLGWSLGARWKLALHLIQHYTLPTLAVVAVLLTLYIVVMRKVKRRMQARYEASPVSENVVVKERERHLLHV